MAIHTNSLEVRESKAELRTSRADTIAVVGLGYVGLPLALLAEDRGYRVIGFDIDVKRIDELNHKRSSSLSLEKEKHRLEKNKIRFASESRVLGNADVFIICVPTPVDHHHEPDFAPLARACEIVGAYVRKDSLVIVESTVNPGACEEIALPILERISGLTAERDFAFAHCPERINPGDSNYDVENIPRVVGGRGPKSLARATHLYRTILNADVVPMSSIKEAEAVKMVENSFRDINIAFVNELAMAFNKAGIDIVNVIRGASTKPFGFMPHLPGCGVGGHCIPVDPYYLIRYGKKNGFNHRFLMAAREINSSMPQYTVDLLEEELEKSGRFLHGSTIALLGVAYKADISDMRESPALEIRSELFERGARVDTYDPHVPSESTARSLEEALEHADAVIIATDHRAFKNLTPEVFEKFGIDIVVDGRNCLSKEAFEKSNVVYRGIGR